MIFDWYKTHASSVTAGAKVRKSLLEEKAVYIPKTDGNTTLYMRRCLLMFLLMYMKYCLLLTITASPMRSIQTDRLWAINGGSDLNGLGQFVTGLRSKGVER